MLCLGKDMYFNHNSTVMRKRMQLSAIRVASLTIKILPRGIILLFLAVCVHIRHLLLPLKQAESNFHQVSGCQ